MLFQDLTLFIYMPVCLCVDICTQVLVPVEAARFPQLLSYRLPNVDAGSPAHVPLTSIISIPPTLCFETILSLAKWISLTLEIQ